MALGDHLTLVESLFEAWSRDDLEEWLTFIDPDAEFDYTELDRPYGAVFRGRERIEAFYHEASDPWRTMEFLIEDPLVSDDLLVVDVTRMSSSLLALTFRPARRSSHRARQQDRHVQAISEQARRT